MLCNRCGGEYREVVKDRTVDFRGRSVTVPTRYLECIGCGEVLIRPQDSGDSSRRAADIVRREEKLLTSAEIRTIRERLGLTQHKLEEVLGIGVNTVVRWEGGTVIQSRLADNILRSLDEVPGLLENMAERNGVQLEGRSRVNEPLNRVAARLFSDLVSQFEYQTEITTHITTRGRLPYPITKNWAKVQDA